MTKEEDAILRFRLLSNVMALFTALESFLIVGWIVPYSAYDFGFTDESRCI